ncbi:hypothetical protein [Stutzerimonas stutzeri]|nr:hypothetical protein [Stutzerimonas stutzeri]MCQ4328629.1 hypothetical protein [Stutzerimonas stutzeri]
MRRQPFGRVPYAGVPRDVDGSALVLRRRSGSLLAADAGSRGKVVMAALFGLAHLGVTLASLISQILTD